MRLDKMVLEHMRHKVTHFTLKQAQALVRDSLVYIDGRICCDPKYHVFPGVEIVGMKEADQVVPLAVSDQPLYVMNKPRGVISQRHPIERNVYELIPKCWQREDLGAFGRLDVDTTGALLFGTDGGTQSLLTSPSSQVWKIYVAELSQQLPDFELAVKAFADGLILTDGTTCAPATLQHAGERRVHVSLHEGFFHQVKRMLAHVGGRVCALHRECFGSVAVEDLAPGGMRRLTPADLDNLVKLLPADRTLPVASSSNSVLLLKRTRLVVGDESRLMDLRKPRDTN